MKRSYKLLVLTGSILVIAAVAFYFNGLQGEVFLVTKEGRALPAPGASIQLFREKDDRNLGGFFLATGPANTRFLAGFDNLSDDYAAIDEAYAKGKVKPKHAHVVSELRERLKQREATNLRRWCEDRKTLAVKYFGRPDHETYADRNGKFSLKLLPGTYTLVAKGQAGTAQAFWTEIVPLVWHSEVRIVEPLCQYSME
jgi:hypothetical protein